MKQVDMEIMEWDAAAVFRRSYGTLWEMAGVEQWQMRKTY